MITKGEIQSVNYNNNTCIVRLPIFETAGMGDKAIATAHFSITPGSINAYKEKDIVVVGFEQDLFNKPIILGKFYINANDETTAAKTRTSYICQHLTATDSVTLPYDVSFEAPNSAGGKNKTSYAAEAFTENDSLIKLIQNTYANTTKLNNIKANTVFSVAEQQIGTWIDNKPIYRKTIELTNLSSLTPGVEYVKECDVSSLNCDMLWVDLNNSILITEQNNTTKYILNQYYANGGSDYWNTYIDKSVNKLYYRIKLPGNNTAKKLILTLTYTKNNT